MPHPNKAKGSRWELAVERAFTGLRRRNHNGQHDDWGDLEEVLEPRTWVIEGKDSAKNLGEFIRQLESEMARSGRRRGAVFLKRRSKGPLDCYVIMPGYVFEEVRTRLQDLERAANEITRLHNLPQSHADALAEKRPEWEACKRVA